jgi:hypothetical protein
MSTPRHRFFNAVHLGFAPIDAYISDWKQQNHGACYHNNRSIVEQFFLSFHYHGRSSPPSLLLFQNRPTKAPPMSEPAQMKVCHFSQEVIQLIFADNVPFFSPLFQLSMLSVQSILIEHDAFHTHFEEVLNDEKQSKGFSKPKWQ